LLRALPRSYQVTPDIPGPATSDTAKGGQTHNGADSLKESQLAAGPGPSPRHRTSPTPRITTASLEGGVPVEARDTLGIDEVRQSLGSRLALAFDAGAVPAE